MKALVTWLRQWLGIDDDQRVVRRLIDGLRDDVRDLEKRVEQESQWRREFVQGLRGAKEKARYTDFETSQVKVMEEFREG